MDFTNPEATDYFERDSWLYVHDGVVHRLLTGNFGYHVVHASQATVVRNWNLVYSHYFLFVPPDEIVVLTGAYWLNMSGFHPLGGVCRPRQRVLIYASAKWFDEGVLIEQPSWLEDYLSADGF